MGFERLVRRLQVSIGQTEDGLLKNNRVEVGKGKPTDLDPFTINLPSRRISIKSNFSQMQILVVRQQGSHELMSEPRQNERKRSSQCFHTYLSLYVIPWHPLEACDFFAERRI